MPKKKRKASKQSHRGHHKGGALFLSTLVLLIVLFLRYGPEIVDVLGDFNSPFHPETPTDGTVSVHYIDVGQGDSILILTPEGNAMLIDAGTAATDTYLVEYLRNLKIETLDYFVLTHPHADHIGGAAAIFDAFVIEEVMMPDAISDSKTFQNVLEKIDAEGCPLTVPKPNDTHSLGNTVLTVLGPVQEYEELNDTSLVLRMDYGTTSFLFTGDAEAPAEADMLAYHSSALFDVDVLKLGHHGSSTSSSSAWLDAVSPTYAIASCGKDNSYGHPHAEIIAQMSERSIVLYRTDECGTVILTTDGKVLTPSGQKPSLGKAA